MHSRAAVIRCGSSKQNSGCATITLFWSRSKPKPTAFKSHQQAAFEAERERWAAAGQAEFIEPPEPPSPGTGRAKLRRDAVRFARPLPPASGTSRSKPGSEWRPDKN